MFIISDCAYDLKKFLLLFCASLSAMVLVASASFSSICFSLLRKNSTVAFILQFYKKYNNSSQQATKQPCKYVPNDTPIHVSVSDLYIPMIGLHILLQENSVCGPILVIYKSLTDTRMWKFGLRPRNSFSGIFFAM